MKLNGNKGTIFTTVLVALMLFYMGINGMYTQVANDVVNQSAKDIRFINQSFFAFTDNFYERQQIGNQRGNATQNQLLNISQDLKSAIALLIVQQNNTNNLLEGRTPLFEQIINELNQTVNNLQKFNQTNEEKRIVAVNNLTKSIQDGNILTEIGNNVSIENNQLLKQLLNKTN